MEFTLQSKSLKTFARSVTCLARIGNELVVRASPSELAFHTLNASKSAYQLITFKPDFFDSYAVTEDQVKCSVLLKDVCAVLRTPLAAIDNLAVQLPDSDASKLQWVLECENGVRKTYRLNCNVDPDIQELSLEKEKYSSNFVVQPTEFSRLLANFQSSLQEITIIATERNSIPSDTENEIGGKAVELRSYLDPAKENDSSLHTQLWIDPLEEFVQYIHEGDPVDVTFGVKELKAILSFCEGCEVDTHLYFEKSGEPILVTPHHGLDFGITANFDATLVLATMLTSQLREGNASDHPDTANRMPAQAEPVTTAPQQERNKSGGSENLSNHTRIWSELSGSAARSGSGSDVRPVPEKGNSNVNDERELQRISNIHISNAASIGRAPNADTQEDNGRMYSQRHPSNWVDPGEEDEDEDDEDEEDDNELCVQATPPYYDEQ